MNVARRYYACRACGKTCTPWDAWAGVGAIQVTEHARKMIVIVSTAWSFDRASAKLAELCAIKVSDDTIERVCQDEGTRARKWLRCDERTSGSGSGNGSGHELVEAFRQAPGDPEFYSDGLKMNTTDGGWRELRLNLLQKRERATPVTPQQWTQRVLPEASVRLASCAIADSRRTGAMWQQWSERLDLSDSPDLSVLADGAPWIWEQAQRRLSPNAQWCVDVYHVSEHLHACAKAMFSDKGDAARAWADDRLDELIAQGGPAFLRQLDQRVASCTDAGHVATMTRRCARTSKATSIGCGTRSGWPRANRSAAARSRARARRSAPG